MNVKFFLSVFAISILSKKDVDALPKAESKIAIKSNDIVNQKALSPRDSIVRIVAQSNYYPNDYNYAKSDPLNKKIIKILTNKNSFSALIINKHIVTDLKNIVGKKNIYMLYNNEKLYLNLIGYDKASSVAVLKPKKELNNVYDFNSKKGTWGEKIKIIGFDSIFTSVISKIDQNNMFTDKVLPHSLYGAAVLNDKNEFIGMIKAEKSSDMANFVEQIIPSAILKNIVNQIIKNKRVIRGSLGFTLDGKTITSVLKGSAMDSMGVIPGMTIESINEKSNLIKNEYKPGQVVNLVIKMVDNNGEIKTSKMKTIVGEYVNIMESITDDNLEVNTYVFSNNKMENSAYFQEIIELPQELKEYVANKVNDLSSYFNSYKNPILSGVLVVKADENNIFKKGDIIKLIGNHVATMTLIHTSYAMLKSFEKKNISFTIIRNGKVITVDMYANQLDG